MKEVIYRDIKKSDYEAIENLIVKTFNLDKYIEDEKVLTEIKHSYLQGCLAERTFCMVAEHEGKVVGVIMSNAKKEYNVIKHIPAIAKTLHYNLKIARLGRKNNVGVEGYENVHKTYADFIKDRKDEYDGVLTLFLVDESLRGYGIGRKLLNFAEKYYHRYRVKKIYLFTDSSCNTGFYDSHDFKKRDRKDLIMAYEGKKKILNVFLYEKTYV